MRNAVEDVGRVLSDALSDAAAATAESSLVKSPPLIKTVAAINSNHHKRRRDKASSGMLLTPAMHWTATLRLRLIVPHCDL